MQAPLPLTRELVLIGGGHAHALALRMWGMKPLPGVRVSVINPGPTAPYSGMLPGFVAGHYARESLDIDLVRLARFAGARLIAGRAAGLDRTTREVVLEDGRRLPWHVASVDIGITSDLPDLPGFAEHATPAKPLDTFAQRWTDFLARAARRELPARVVMIGAGVAGVELALAMEHALSRAGVTPEITVVERARALPGLHERTRRALFSQMRKAGIALLEQAEIVRVEPAAVVLADGRSLPSAFTVGAGGARPQGWLAETGLALEGGFIAVDETLRSLNTPEVFAVGDCAHLSHAPRPKAGVFAVRAAPVLFHNLRAALSGGRMRPFRPQRDYLKLISTGSRTAVADKWGFRAHGARLWRLKDRIDRKFMRQFHELRPMAPPPLPRPHALGVDEALGGKPLCGGCGAKVGGGALSRALATLPRPERADVLSGPGDDAAVLAGPEGRAQVITTDQLRAFTEDTWLMARIAAVHALGDIWAMGARPQAALATITLPRLSTELQEGWLREIMEAAGEVFAAEGATLVGGHSAMGSELSIGFTVTGLSEGAPITLAGARPGDALILTRPIGTGTILAAEMAMQAPGAHVLAALGQMARPQGDAARLLAPLAHAMTDITGFGLAGHLLEMARASGVTIELDLAAIPLLAGAERLATQGVRSSLWADNRALLAGLELPDSPRAALLFDPQTAGGLAAAVPRTQAEDLLRELEALGHEAHVIGQCREGAGRLRIRAG